MLLKRSGSSSYFFLTKAFGHMLTIGWAWITVDSADDGLTSFDLPLGGNSLCSFFSGKGIGDRGPFFDIIHQKSRCPISPTTALKFAMHAPVYFFIYRLGQNYDTVQVLCRCPYALMVMHGNSRTINSADCGSTPC